MASRETVSPAGDRPRRDPQGRCVVSAGCAGLCRRCPSACLLTQHPLAGAARSSLRCSRCRSIGHSKPRRSPNLKPSFRCNQDRSSRSGTNPTFPKPLARQCSAQVRKAPFCKDEKPTFNSGKVHGAIPGWQCLSTYVFRWVRNFQEKIALRMPLWRDIRRRMRGFPQDTGRLHSPHRR